MHTLTPTGAECTSPLTSSPTNFPGCSSGEKVFKLSLLTDQWGSETSWEVTGPNGVVKSGDGYGGNSAYTEKHCIPNDACEFVISDTFGDGICCDQGNGSYQVWVDGVEKGDDGVFSSSETVQLCTSAPSSSSPPDTSPTPGPTAAPITPPTTAPTAAPPAPTAAPVTPTTPAPVASCITVNINVVTDDYPAETSWYIADEDGYAVASSDSDFHPCLE
eukprot:12920538-Ditylum_brightwellii.AAC.1